MPKMYDNVGIGGPQRNPPPPPPPPPAGETRKASSFGARIAKFLLIATGGTIIGIVVTKKWDSWFGKKDDDEGDSQPAMGWPGMSQMPTVMPMPVPYPFPMLQQPPSYPPPPGSFQVEVQANKASRPQHAIDTEVADADEDDIYQAEMNKYRKKRAKIRARRDAEVEELFEEFDIDTD